MRLRVSSSVSLIRPALSSAPYPGGEPTVPMKKPLSARPTNCVCSPRTPELRRLMEQYRRRRPGRSGSILEAFNKQLTRAIRTGERRLNVRGATATSCARWLFTA